MRTLVPSIAACLVLAAAGGCSDPVRAPLDVSWTFGTLDCDQVGISTIHVEVAKELLNPSDFACIDPTSRGVTTGAHLGAFLLGQYSITVVGFDATGAEVIRGSKVISVRRGENVVTVDAGGAVTLRWTFAGSTCAQAGVTAMNLSVDGNVITDAAGNPDIPCTQASQDAAQISPLLAGSHSFDLVGLVNGAPSYAASVQSVAVQDGQDRQLPVDLPAAAPTTATADLQFSFGGLTCAAARVDTVRVRVDPFPDGTGGIDAGEVPCNANGVDGAEVTGLSAGMHSFAILGIRGTQLVYATTRPPAARFEIGLHTSVAVDAPPVGSPGLVSPPGSTAISELRAPVAKAPSAFPAPAR